MRFTFALVSAIAVAGVAASANARDYISIAGSSTVLPFATIVAEQLGTNPSFKTPVVESGGSSVGKKGVCEGIGTEFIDIGNASSRMKIGELEYCNSNGVDLTEIKVGYDGIVVANSKEGTPLVISKSDLGIARTIAVSPEVILMDEPCSALDPIATAKIEELIHELSSEFTIVIVTHSMQQAARVSHRTAYFHLGKLVEVGDTAGIFSNPSHEMTRNYITGRFG